MANTISVSSTGANAGLAAKLSAAPNQLTPALDAVVRIGSATGTPIRQASNTFSVIDGVTMTVSKAQAAGSAPLTLTVASDSSKTAANAQAFVDNKLKAAIDGLVSPGDPASGGPAGAFASDSGVRALRDRMISALRSAGATSLANFGITADRQGALTLDSTRLTKALALNPTGLDTLIGSSATTGASGIARQLDGYLKLWTNSSNGQIGSRKNAVSELQSNLTGRQTTPDKQYDSA